ncbi:hypothetical protein IHE55_09140 [Streptomyces pactum]|uniref:Uncharacterized protein n=1 Tax=Streptomyces pactum TaxID=68249 RepID=A0ABS0NIC0_9ACTN|nr:hypothetical protein [Streptomyces pactum]MBH5334948.1 hypothetical protein [Streptomyces pactum]
MDLIAFNAVVPFTALASALALVAVSHPDPAVRGRALRVLETLSRFERGW